MKILGKILMVIGALGTMFYGYEAIKASNSVNIFGETITVTSGDWTPVIVSLVVLVVGVVINRK